MYGMVRKAYGSSEERGAFSRNATKTWVEVGDLPSVCRAPLSSLVPSVWDLNQTPKQSTFTFSKKLKDKIMTQT